MIDGVNEQTVNTVRPSSYTHFCRQKEKNTVGMGGRRRRDQTIRAQSCVLRDWKSGAKEGSGTAVCNRLPFLTSAVVGFL